MIDIVLLVGRLLLIALLYIFLFALMRTGIGLVKGQRAKEKQWMLQVEQGPRGLRGLKIYVNGPVVAGRAPGCDIVVDDGYVSARHAQFEMKGRNLFVEDLRSTNGTAVNGRPVSGPYALHANDVVSIGDVSIRVRYA